MDYTDEFDIPESWDWTPTMLNQASACLYLLHLMKREKIPTLTTGPMFMGTVVHDMMPEFYKTEKDGSVRPYYTTRDKFANAARARWFHLRKERFPDHKMEWKDDYEENKLIRQMERICKIVYDRYENEEPPVAAELKFPTFEIEGRKFHGIIDEIRRGENGPIVRDHKTGWAIPDEMSQNFDPQLTIYALAICCMAYENPEFAEKVGISREDAETFAGNPDFISELVDVEFYMMRHDQVVPGKRSNIQYHDLTNMIDGFEYRLSHDEIYVERGKKCDYCLGRRSCNARTGAISVPREPVQLNFFGRVPELPERRLKVKSTQKSFRFPKKEG